MADRKPVSRMTSSRKLIVYGLSGHDMSLFNATTVLGSRARLGQGSMSSVPERLGAAANVDELNLPRRLRCSLS
jgi:hypothetical protein